MTCSMVINSDLIVPVLIVLHELVCIERHVHRTMLFDFLSLQEIVLDIVIHTPIRMSLSPLEIDVMPLRFILN